LNAITPNWPAPPGIMAFVTTRSVGNLARHVGEKGEADMNRRRMAEQFALPAEPLWLQQVHGDQVVVPEFDSDAAPTADAAYTRAVARPLAIMVADCLPILLASRSGQEIAAVHAGWRGLAAGVIGAALSRFEESDVVAWLGPAIGPCHYEVDGMVRDAFDDDTGFLAGRDAAHWMMSLCDIAKLQLMQAGVSAIYGGGFCTFCDDRFYSHRRDGEINAGRIAAVIWKR